MVLVDLPTLKVEIAVGHTIADDYSTLGWIDVTSRLRAAETLSWSRGRPAVGEPPTPGQLTFNLDNRDGGWNPGSVPVDPSGDSDFDAGEFGGEFGGETAAAAAVFTVRSPVRVQARTGATWRDLWLGFITDIEWLPKPGDIQVRVQAADTLSRAGKILCRPWMQGRHKAVPNVVGDGPIGYWPLDEAADATAARSQSDPDSSPQPDLNPVADVYPSSGYGSERAYATWQIPGPHPDDTAIAFTPYIDVSANDYIGWRLKSQSPVLWSNAGSKVVFSVWVQPNDGGVVFGLDADGSTRQAFEFVNSPNWDGWATVLIALAGKGSAAWDVQLYGAVESLPGSADGWRHFAVAVDYNYRNGGGNWTAADYGSRYRVFVDGYPVDLPWTVANGSLTNSDLGHTDGGAYEPAGATLTIGGSDLKPADMYSGRVAHFAIHYVAQIGDGPPDEFADRGQSEPATTRFTALADCTSQPDALRTWMTADAGTGYPVSAQECRDQRLLTLLQQVADVERGNVIADRSGLLRFQTSRSRYSATPVLTLDADSDVLTADGAFGQDDADSWDSATVTRRPAGDSHTAERDGSAGLESTSFDLWTSSPTHAESIAAAAANTPAANRSPRLNLSMEQMAQRGLADTLLQLELGDLIRVTNLPTSAPLGTLDLTVEAIAHTVGKDGWQVTLDTGPGDLARAACVGTGGGLSTVSPTLTIRP